MIFNPTFDSKWLRCLHGCDAAVNLGWIHVKKMFRIQISTLNLFKEKLKAVNWPLNGS